MALGEERPNTADSWTFRVVVGVLAAVVVFAAARAGGRYLHNDEAWALEKKERPPGPMQAHERALEVAAGYADTPSFGAVREHLTAEEIAAATVKKHPAEQYAPAGAAAAFVIVLLSTAEAGLLWARRQAARRSQQRR